LKRNKSHRRGISLNLSAINSCKLYGDKDKISQVITNLITNAIKYSPGKDSVELGIEKDEHCVYLKVKDQGVGIPKGKQQKVFERFYRVDGDSRKKIDGLGLGLYISMEIIKKHKGKMGVESEEGKVLNFGLACLYHRPVNNDGDYTVQKLYFHQICGNLLLIKARAGFLI
jgi:signal transduction histidine kinase